MAKSRAQRKAERRRREQQRQQQADAQAQHDTQVPEHANVQEAELAARGADLDELRGDSEETPPPQAPAPSRGERAPARSDVEAMQEARPDRITRRELKRQERERKAAAKASQQRRQPKEEAPERERGRVMAFLISCVAELRRVQWPNRETLIQASAVTLVFIAVAAAYLGVLDGIFNWVVQRII